MTVVLIRRGGSTKDAHAQGKAMRGQSKKAAICKTRREASEETKPADILILDF